MSLRVGSLFTGIGGFDLGFQQAGATVAWQVEIDKWCQKLLRYRFPEVELHENVNTVGRHNLAPVDVICGGFPCQDISVAGKRAGLAGQRSGLFFQFARIADEFPTAWLLIENVFGLLSSPEGNTGGDFQVVLAELTGFCPDIPADGWRTAGICHGPKRTVSWRVLDSRYFGVAQRRRRVFLVAGPRARCGAEVLFEPERMPWDPPESQEAQKDVAGTLKSNTSRSRGVGLPPELLVAGTLGSASSRSRGSRIQPEHIVDDVAATLGGNQGGGVRHDDIDSNGALIPVLSGTLQHSGKAAGSATQQDAESDMLIPVAYGGNNTSGPIDIATACRAKGGSGHGDFESETFVFDPAQITSQANRSTCRPGDPCHTLAADQAVAAVAIHGSQDPDVSNEAHPLTSTHSGNTNAIFFRGVRRLTPREYEVLQGFPTDYTLITPKTADSPRYKALGNAVTVPVAYWLAKRIKEVHER